MNLGESDKRNQEYLKLFTIEKFFHLLIPKNNPLIIDIGAHWGESAVFFKNLYPQSYVYSLEPDPDSFQVLSHCNLDNFAAFNLAVTSTSGRVTFHRYEKDHLNSLYSINKDSVDSVGYARSAVSKEIEVECITLDDFVEKAGLGQAQIDLLKIDAQGAEVDILSGAQSSLKKIENITIEISFFDFYTKKNSFFNVERFIKDFELYAITKLSQNPKNFRTDWAEVVYRKSSLNL